MFVLFSFVIFNGVENINDAAHVLGIADSALDKLEALENAAFIDQDGKDLTLWGMRLVFTMFLSDMRGTGRKDQQK